MASARAFPIAAAVPIAPLSPMPLAPSGFSGDSDSTNAPSRGGMSAAVKKR